MRRSNVNFGIPALFALLAAGCLGTDGLPSNPPVDAAAPAASPDPGSAPSGETPAGPDGSILPEARTFREWIEDLGGEDEEVARRAGAALEAGGEETAWALSDLLETAEHPLRSRLLTVLVALDEKAVPPLARCVVQGSLKSRRAALETLARIGASAVPALAAAARDGRPEVRALVARVLGDRRASSESAALAVLAGLACDTAPSVWRQAFRSLTRMGAPAVPVLVDLLAREPRIRSAALQTLGNLENRAASATPAVTGVLRGDPDPEMRACAAYVLASIHPAGDSVLALTEALCGDPEAGVRRSAAVALGRCPREGEPFPAVAVQALAACLRPGEPIGLRREAARALGAIGPPAGAALNSLLEALDDDSLELAALSALGKIRQEPERVASALAACLEDPRPEVRRAAAQAAGTLGEAGTAVVPALVAMLGEKDAPGEGDDAYEIEAEEGAEETVFGSLRLHALRALTKMGRAAGEALPAMVLLARNGFGGFDPQEVFQAMAAVGTVSAVLPELACAARSETGEVRAASANVIKTLLPADRDAMPMLEELARSPDAGVAGAAKEAIGKAGPAE